MTRMMTGRRVDARVLPVEEVRRAIASHADLAVDLRPRLLHAIDGLPVTSIGTKTQAKSWYLRYGKRAFDITLVLLAAPFVLPLVAFAALLLLFESGVPFYTQDRMRADGSRYRIWKLRSMVRDADKIFDDLLASDPALRQEWDETQKLKNDPRITPIGKILRATSLDELPQLWSVFTGDMSLIGPRPVMPDQVKIYKGPLYWGMRPGVSGLWQVSERNDRNFDYRAEMDGVYSKQVSFREDLSIIARTFSVILRRTGY